MLEILGVLVVQEVPVVLAASASAWASVLAPASVLVLVSVSAWDPVWDPALGSVQVSASDSVPALAPDPVRASARVLVREWSPWPERLSVRLESSSTLSTPRCSRARR